MNIKLNTSDDFDFSVENRNLLIVTGTEELAQVLSIILKTYVGENKFAPNFGTRLQDILGETPTDNEIRQLIKRAILSDKRFSGVENIKIFRNRNHTISMEFNVKVKNGNMLNIGGELIW